MPTASMQIKLRSSDGESFSVDVEVAKMSETIRNMLECLGENDNVDEEVPLPNVMGATLKRVIQWCTYHKGDPPLDAGNLHGDKSCKLISSWDQNFFKVDQSVLFEVIEAANYLDIKGLLDVALDVVASLIKGKSPEEIRQTFNIKNDFVPAGMDGQLQNVEQVPAEEQQVRDN